MHKIGEIIKFIYSDTGVVPFWVVGMGVCDHISNQINFAYNSGFKFPERDVPSWSSLGVDLSNQVKAKVASAALMCALSFERFGKSALQLDLQKGILL